MKRIALPILIVAWGADALGCLNGEIHELNKSGSVPYEDYEPNEKAPQWSVSRWPSIPSHTRNRNGFHVNIPGRRKAKIEGEETTNSKFLLD